jgi:hypothetical protein
VRISASIVLLAWSEADESAGCGEGKRMRGILAPSTLDGATVLKVADVSHATATGQTRHTVAGHEVSGFAALALAQYDLDPGVYLLYCDKDWNVVTDTYHDNLEGAIAQAEFEFGSLQFTDVKPS